MESVNKFITRYSRDFQGNLQVDPNGSWVLAGDAAIRDKKLTDKIASLQQRLTVQDQRVDEYEYRLGKVSSVMLSVRFALEGKGKIGWEDRCIELIDALNPTAEAVSHE